MTDRRSLFLFALCLWLGGVGLIAGLALAQPGPGGPAPGMPKVDPTATLRICHKTSIAEVIYLATISIVGQQFRAQGWTPVKRGECATLGPFERPKAWWHARAPQGTAWGSPAVHVCANLNAGFDYTWSGSGRKCTPDEVMLGFKEEEFSPLYNQALQTLTD